MTLQDLGALGELIGGIAVIASVLYLAMQIRHGLEGYRSTMTQEVTSHFSRMQLEIAKSPELLAAWDKAEKGEELTSLEQRAVLQVVSSYLIGFENLFVQHKTGMIAKDAYLARRVVIKHVLACTGAMDWWQHYGRFQHSDDFATEVALILEED